MLNTPQVTGAQIEVGTSQDSLPVIQTEQLIKYYDQTCALKGVNTSARRGEVIGLLGKNGAGKSTLMECLLGFAPATSGRALLWGESSRQISETNKHRIGYVPQTDELLPNLSVNGWLELLAKFYPRWDFALQARLLREWELPGDSRCGKLSIGQKQKVAIISALCYHPELLILDEPVASLDPIARRQFLQEIVHIAADGNATILFSTHIISDLERIANRVWLLQAGELTFDGELDQLKESVVRVHAHCADVHWADGVKVLRTQSHAAGCTYALAQWTTKAEQDFQAHYQGDVERLSLEDIFMELHA